jgi:hypothetical protein
MREGQGGRIRHSMTEPPCCVLRPELRRLRQCGMLARARSSMARLLVAAA